MKLWLAARIRGIRICTIVGFLVSAVIYDTFRWTRVCVDAVPRRGFLKSTSFTKEIIAHPCPLIRVAAALHGESRARNERGPTRGRGDCGAFAA